jgi:DNA repair protein RecN (Recombination protein N)
MLRELRIANFAVIEEVSLDLGRGLNVLTGETGAGKTMVMEALTLLCGGRAAADVIRHGRDEASVEALFAPVPKSAEEALTRAGYAAAEELVVRRILSRSGKNRAYLNGNLCPVALLAEVGERMIHIYGQHEHHELLRSESHLDLLDGYSGLAERRAAMRERFLELGRSWERLEQTRALVAKSRRQEDEIREQAREIEEARLRVEEEDELKEKRNILMHAEKLYQGCKEGEELLYESDDAVAGRLARYLARLRELARIDPSLEAAVGLIEASQAQLEEASGLLRRHTSKAEFDPNAVEKLEERLEQIARLKRKYGGTVGEIIDLRRKFELELEEMDRGDEEIPRLERGFEESRKIAWEMAETLSGERRRSAKKFKKEIEEELKHLGMAGTVFEPRFQPAQEGADALPFFIGGRRLTETGADAVEFYFSPNPGEPAKPLVKIASGGELSRLMLAIKSLTVARGEVPTLLFDEVDAGIGGRVAEIVGRKLKQVAGDYQVLCVTHLPQIAALADCQYVVTKETARGRTFTRVKKLERDERVEEIARMLGGLKITEKTRRHAEEMLRGH